MIFFLVFFSFVNISDFLLKFCENEIYLMELFCFVNDFICFNVLFLLLLLMNNILYVYFFDWCSFFKIFFIFLYVFFNDEFLL